MVVGIEAYANQLLNLVQHKQKFDTWIDRLHYLVTPMILAFFAALTAGKQYFGSPLTCIFSADINKANWIAYANDFCFVHNTYQLPDQIIPKNFVHRRELEIHYYQWVSIALALHALMFYAPSRVCKFLVLHSGINVNKLVEDGKKCAQANSEVYDFGKFANAIRHSLAYSNANMNTAKQINLNGKCNSAPSNFLTLSYLFIKLLYILNAVGQFYLMNMFLGVSGPFWTFNYLANMRGESLFYATPVPHFPRHTWCDVHGLPLDISLKNPNPVTGQCILTLNMFNEKIFFFLNIWFFVIIAFGIGDLLYWALILTPCVRSRYIKRALTHSNYCRLPNEDRNNKDSKEIDMKKDAIINDTWLDLNEFKVQQFVSRMLGADGTFLIRVIALHAGELLAFRLVRSLFDMYESCWPQQFDDVLRNTMADESGRIRVQMSMASQPSDYEMLTFKDRAGFNKPPIHPDPQLNERQMYISTRHPNERITSPTDNIAQKKSDIMSMTHSQQGRIQKPPRRGNISNAPTMQYPQQQYFDNVSRYVSPDERRHLLASMNQTLNSPVRQRHQTITSMH